MKEEHTKNEFSGSAQDRRLCRALLITGNPGGHAAPLTWLARTAMLSSFFFCVSTTGISVTVAGAQDDPVSRPPDPEVLDKNAVRDSHSRSRSSRNSVIAGEGFSPGLLAKKASSFLAEAQKSDEQAAKRPELDRSSHGNQPVTGAPAAAPEVVASAATPAAKTEDKAEINIRNADLDAVLRIFSKRTKRNFILDERVKGKVSVFLPGGISAQDSTRILDSILALKGFTSVPMGENLYKILPSREAKQSTIPTILGKRPSDPTATVVTRLIQLSYVGAEDIRQIVSQLVSADGMVSSYAGSNALIIIDSEDNIARVEEIIENLDVPARDREMMIIPVKHAEAKELADKLLSILTEKQGGTGVESIGSSDLIRGRMNDRLLGMGSQPVSPGGLGNVSNVAANVSGPAGGGAIGGRAREPKIIPDERTNSIIVVADESTGLQIKALISKLDSKVDLGGVQFWVYRCQHAKADDLSSVLASMVGEGGGSGGSSSGNSSKNSSGFGSESDSAGSLNRSGRNNRSRSGISGGGSSSRNFSSLASGNDSSSGSAGATSVKLGENFSITSDPSTNSIIIRGTRSQYFQLLELLKKLDIKRRQVLVEAVLLEVGVDQSEDLGLSFLGSTGSKDVGIATSLGLSNITDLLSNPQKISRFATAATSTGTLQLPGGVKLPTQALLVEAARQNSNVNVLSAPTILATDNEDAQIVVGQNVPFLTGQGTNESNLNNTFNQIDRQDVGIKLQIRPQISSRDSVTLKLFTEVSNVVASTQNSEFGPTTTVRTSETTVIAKNGQMIVTGGLMSDDVTEAENGIPLLMDIPVLGHLFKTTNEIRRRTNLLIFITPKIVADQFDARDLTVGARDKLSSSMEEIGIGPNRDSVLNSPDIDNVAFAEREESSAIVFGEGAKDPDLTSEELTAKRRVPQALSKKPTSIIGSMGSDTGTSIRRASSTSGQIQVEVLQSEPAVALEPPLPSAKVSSAQGKPKPFSITRPSPEAGVNNRKADSLEPAFVESKTEDRTGNAAASFVEQGLERFIVLEPIGVTNESRSFKLNDRGLAVIRLPEGLSAKAGAFFKPNETYHYGTGTGAVTYVVVAVAPSLKAIATTTSLPPEVQTLSPFEIMRLGKGPWYEGAAN